MVLYLNTLHSPEDIVGTSLEKQVYTLNSVRTRKYGLGIYTKLKTMGLEDDITVIRVYIFDIVTKQIVLLK